MSRNAILAASAALVLAAGPALAQNGGQGDAVNPYSADNVPAERPFGEIDVSGAGENAAAVGAYLGALTGAQVIELIQRCLVIDPMSGWWTPQAAAARAEGQGDAAAAMNNLAGGGQGPAGGVNAPGNQAAVDAASPAATAASPYATEAVSLCANIRTVLFGEMPSDTVMPSADQAPAQPSGQAPAGGGPVGG